MKLQNVRTTDKVQVYTDKYNILKYTFFFSSSMSSF